MQPAAINTTSTSSNSNSSSSLYVSNGELSGKLRLINQRHTAHANDGCLPAWLPA
jgi:hypothetical protein